MKNLFNDISQEEKSRILEMHSGKKNVISEDVPTGINTSPTSMNTNVAVVTPKDYVLTDHGMGQIRPYLIKKNTPMSVNNGIVTIKGFYGESISNSLISQLLSDGSVSPEDVKITGNAVIKYNCKDRMFDVGEEEEKGGLSGFIRSKFCR